MMSQCRFVMKRLSVRDSSIAYILLAGHWVSFIRMRAVRVRELLPPFCHLCPAVTDEQVGTYGKGSTESAESSSEQLWVDSM